MRLPLSLPPPLPLCARRWLHARWSTAPPSTSHATAGAAPPRRRSKALAELDTGWVIEQPPAPGGSDGAAAGTAAPAASNGAKRGSSRPAAAAASPAEPSSGGKPSPDAVLLQRRCAEGYEERALQRALRELDAHVGAVWAALPPRTLLVVASGAGDVYEWRRLQVGARVHVCTFVEARGRWPVELTGLKVAVWRCRCGVVGALLQEQMFKRQRTLPPGSGVRYAPWSHEAAAAFEQFVKQQRRALAWACVKQQHSTQQEQHSTQQDGDG